MEWTELITTKEMSDIYRVKEITIRRNLKNLSVPMIFIAAGVYLMKVSDLENAISRTTSGKMVQK